MKESLQQHQEQRLQQRLTPMQVQFVRMLEMTGPEIEAEVKRAVEDMPALEVDDADSDSVGAASQGTDDNPDAPFTESSDQMQAADYSGDDDTPSYMLEGRNRSASDEFYRPDASNDEPSLLDELLQQISELDLDRTTDMIARYVAGNIDSNGYLRRDAQSMADDLSIASGRDIDLEDVEYAVEIVRRLDPAGVGASDLRDCLLLQLRRKPQSASPHDKQGQPTPLQLATEIIDKHFNLFTKKHYAELASALHVDNSRLAEALDVISKLNPKPGNQHGDTALDSSARQIVPEFLVETDDADRSVTVTLLNNLPRLTLSATFTDESSAAALPPRAKADALTFMRTRRDEAATFMRTLEMRQSTLFNVMAAIARIQREFFLTGDETKLRPMVLRDIADITGYDLSVISRATASKYVAAPSGTYPLKHFFNERRTPDDDTTFHQIAAALRKLIEKENKQAPLSDEALTEALHAQGFNAARRTVAKYRERLGFPVARLRKEITRK